MNKINNISEEINRIKSLFSEDRLYGNLINETCNDETEAINFLKSKNYKIYDLDADKSTKKSNCNNPSDNLDCIAEILDNNGVNYTQFDHEGKCIITVDGYWDVPNQDVKDRRVYFMFVNDKNEFAYSVEDKNITNVFKDKKGDPLLGNEFEIRGEWICGENQINWEGKVDRYKEEGSTNWINKESKSLSTFIDFSRLKQS